MALTFAAATIGLYPVSIASAASPPLTASITPTPSRADVPANYVETFKANAALAGGTLRTAIPAGWTLPQISAPAGSGYVSASAGSCTSLNITPTLALLAGGATQVTITGITCTGSARFTLSYLQADPLKAGTYTFGPTTVQTSPSANPVTITSSVVKANPGPTAQFALTSASHSTTAGTHFSFTVTPEDAGGDISTYSGTVTFSSSDKGASSALPPPTSITGAHTFSATLTTSGTQAITATDTKAVPTIAGTLSGIAVAPASTALFTWGPLSQVVGTVPTGENPVGSPLGYSLTAMDRFHNVTPGYAGRVLTTSSTDPFAVLPAPYTFVSADHGSHSFQLTPMTAGNQTYTATDSSNPAIAGNATVPVNLAVGPESTTPLTGTVGVLFSQTFAATAAQGNLTWTASGLPAWLSLNSVTGTVSGTPAAATTYGPFTVTATDSAIPPHSGFWTYSLIVGKGSQSLTITSSPPDSPYFDGPTYTPTGSSTAPGLTVGFSADPSTSAVCTSSSGVISFIGTGTCIVDANQPGDADYLAAPQVQQSFSVAGIPQTISFTSTAPTTAHTGGSTYLPTATTTAGHNLVVAFTIDSGSSSVCSIAADDTVSFTGGGTCTVDANQPGDSTYAAAPQVQQSFSVASVQSQTLSFTSSAPVGAVVGATPYYRPVATTTATDPNLSVTLTVDSAAAAICSINPDGTLDFLAAGTCTIDANQAGDAGYLAANQVQQTFTISTPQPVFPTIDVNPTGDSQIPVTPPNPGIVNCPPQEFPFGGCTINDLDGTIGNQFDATQSVDPNADPSHDTVTYHWQIFYPPIFGAGVVFQDAGITGYNSPVLDIVAGSLPELASDSRTAGDPFWRAELTTTVNDVTTTSVFFRFIYDSTISLDFSTDCLLSGQFAGFSCAVVAPQLLPPGTQSLYFTSTAPTGSVVGGAPYTPTTTSFSGLPVTLSIDSASSTVCALDPSGTSVSFIGTGTCTIHAGQPGNNDWVADSVTQSFTVT